MCGIGGIIHLSGPRVSHASLDMLSAALVHRGPDGGGRWLSEDGCVGLVHRRLAILDTSDNGKQPMPSHDGRYLLTYNGEIYNFLELKDDLIKAGFHFATHTDSEVILAAYIHWGEDMLSRFNGMWAIAIWDTLKNELFVARDRFGVKPLVYCCNGRQFSFSSEPKALLKARLSSGEIDLNIARRFVIDAMRVESSTQTLYRDIKNLQAGHCASFNANGLTVRRWWKSVDHLVQVPTSPTARAERFRELFDDSIRLRMRSDVPIGTCLSGGFDSTAIVCRMSRLTSGYEHRQASSWQHAFVASFPGWEYDERIRAEEAAVWAGVAPSILEIRPENALADFDQIVDDLGDVYIDPAIGPWLIYREVRRAGIAVTLDGHGADELMGGYRPAGGSIKHTLQTALASAVHQSGFVSSASDRLRRGILTIQGMNFIHGGNVDQPVLLGDNDEMPREWGPTSRALYKMFHSTILPTLLRNYDRASMAHGIEVRMPFMDWRLATYVMSLPDDAKFASGLTKKVARDAMTGFMPESIRSDPLKIGFNTPIATYFAGPLRDWVQTLLAKQSPAFDAVVNRKKLAETVNRLTAQESWTFANSQRIWPYLNFLSLCRD
jgi:asparagine synthase (glutamine-hydrolysing)